MTTIKKYPNILITGTPGVGKTTTITQLLSLTSTPSTTSSPSTITLKHLSINDLVKQYNLHESYDENLQTLIVDEDKLMDQVEMEISDGNDQGGWLIDWHSTAGFAVRWVDLVVVLRCSDTSVLFDRLTKRGYPDAKVQENMDVEIFGVVAEEAREAWEEDQDGEGRGSGNGSARVVELESVTAEQIDDNCERILEWIRNWMRDHQSED